MVLLLVPLLSLAALWMFAAYLTTGAALGKYETSTTFQKVAEPGFVLMATLQQERVASAVLVSPGGGHDHGGVTTARSHTDGAAAMFRKSALADSVRRSVTAETRQRLNASLTQVDGLSNVRMQIDSGTVDPLGATNDYDAVIDGLLHMFDSVVLLNDQGVYQQGTAILELSVANEFLMREDTLISAALATPGKRLTGPEYTLFARSAANGRYLFDTSTANLEANLRGPFDQLAASADYNTLRSLEDAIVAGGTKASLAPKARTWRASIMPAMKSWLQATTQAGNVLNAEAKPIGNRIMLKLYAAAGIGLLAVIVSIVVSVLFGRSLARELTGLQRTALDLAIDRLPRVIKRLRSGEKVDVDAEVPPIKVGTISEVAKVADALTTLQRTAVESAIAESRLRQGINQVFLNLAWRSQSLLHRQLSMLDTMEREASDPDALEGLFALDHLTTRMRRHAEGLVILSGSAPARGWHNPVAVRDILRGAIAEVEDYTRVVVPSASPAALDGSVVADVTHLLAELIENATAFSPPATQVQVRGELNSAGYTVEIEDRGIGMNETELADANHRLANPPEFDLADSDRLGLFIVGRLAERRSVSVQLTTSPYGGARAVVLIPLDYVASDGGPDYEHTWSEEAPAEPERRPAAIWRASETRTPGRVAPPAQQPPQPQHAQHAPAPAVSRTHGPPPSRISGTGPVRRPDAIRPASRTDPPPRTPGPAGSTIFEPLASRQSSTAPPRSPDPYGHDPYSRDSYGRDGQEAHGQDSYGQNAYGQDTYGQDAYGQNTQGQNTQGQDTYDEDGSRGYTDAGAPELPRRVRQANLVPQLRNDTSASGPAGGASSSSRPPEETRSLMAALQQGWQRGRDEQDLGE
ncbi:MAG: nitrate- and nitrite sensing domain-containing protein [Actinoallomurus sp.]